MKPLIKRWFVWLGTCLLKLILPLRGNRPGDRPVVWMEEWSRSGHNNIRYTALIPRLSSVDAKYLYFDHLLDHHQTGKGMLLRLKQTLAAWGRFWSREIYQLHLLQVYSKNHAALLCTSGNENQIGRFRGPVIVDDDDPEFDAERIAQLNSGNVVCVVTTTELMKTCLIDAGLKRPCHIIPSGVELSRLDKNRTDQLSTQKPEGAIVVGFAIPGIYLDTDDEIVRNPNNRLRSVSLLFEIMERVWQTHPAIALWLIGKPSPAVEHYAASHPQCRLLGYIPHNDLLNYMALFDIALYPRLTDMGGRHSIKLLEYMACGCPIVSMDVNEAFYVGEADCGLVAADVVEFAQHIIALAEDANLRRKLGQRGQQFAQQFDWDHIAARYKTEILEQYVPTVTSTQPHHRFSSV